MEPGPARTDSHFVAAVGAYAFDVGSVRFPGCLEAHAFVDAPGVFIVPALDRDFPPSNRLFLLSFQAGDDDVAIEKVDKETAARRQNASDLFEDTKVLSFAFEIAEGRKEIEDPVEGAFLERQSSHVSGRRGHPCRMCEQGQGEIDSEGAVAAIPHRLSMSARATGQVEHGYRLGKLWRQMALNEVEVLVGLVRVSVRVELQVLLAEPFFVPGHDARSYRQSTTIIALMLQIGQLPVDPPLILAPMAGVTDRDFRLIVRRIGGVGVVTMEFIRSKGLVEGDQQVLERMHFCEEERPVSIQIYGSDAATMAEAAREVERRGADICDINMGCPANKILKGCAGAALMADLTQAEEIIRAVRRAISIPLTVKFRLGLDDARRNFLDLGRICEASGVQAVTLHARTARQRYEGEASWRDIATLKEALTIPVIGNGDVRTPEDAIRMRRETGCDGIMIGRGATRNPWVFQQIAASLGNQSNGPAREPSWEERRDLILDHFRVVIEREEPKMARFKLQTFTGLYSKGLPGGLRLRRQIHSLSTSADFLEAIERFFEDLILKTAA